MKSILMSIQPKWCGLIASGKKTVEVRKTKPKLETPFKVYIYCTNTKPYLVWGDVFRGNWETKFTHLSGYSREEAERIWDVFNGKIIGEFVCDKLVWVLAHPSIFAKHPTFYSKSINDACLTQDEVEQYSCGKDVYGWHISDLVIYDEPKELSEFKKINRECWYADLGLAKRDCPECKNAECFISRPPQSWCYVEGGEVDA